MSEESWTWLIDRQLPSVTASGEQIIGEVIQQLKAHQWPEKEVFGVHLALEEAVVNAIKHGNCLDCSKWVRVACRLSPQRLRIEVTDEGPGFDPTKVPDPTAPENLERPCGRGLMLMRHYMTRVEYSASGNSVIMEKELPADAVGGTQ